jgi:chromosome segregation ATPase
MEFRKDNMSNYCKNCYELTENLENHKRWLNDYKQKLQDAEEFANAKITLCANLIKQLNETHEQLDLLKAENEELKQDYTTAKSMYDLCQSDFMELAKIKDKYKQTLTEIKEIAESCGWNFGSEILYKRIEQILQKISEVEND